MKARRTLRCIKMAFAFSFLSFCPAVYLEDPDAADYMNSLRESLLEGYTSILRALAEQQHGN